ncbi:MAG: MoaD/ThiS family protein [Chitinophagaceae bacterium]
MIVEAYGRLTELLPTSFEWHTETVTLAQLKGALCKAYPLLNKETFVIAVNNQIQHNDALTINSGDSVALMPPFSGG